MMATEPRAGKRMKVTERKTKVDGAQLLDDIARHCPDAAKNHPGDGQSEYPRPGGAL